jgi:hypothetical protein
MYMNEAIGVSTMKRDSEYIALAMGNKSWRQVEASFALEGIDATDDDRVIAGRMIAGELTLDTAITEIRRQHGVAIDAGRAPFVETLQ